MAYNKQVMEQVM